MRANVTDIAGIESLAPFQLKNDFRDRYELRSYVRAMLVAKRLLENPRLIDRGRTYLDRFVRDDPRQARIYLLWTDALRLPMDQLLSDLLADDARGALLRETAPVFAVISADEVRDMTRLAA
jgi:hypothetical protein